MSCTACHDAWPRLNDFGELYRDNGYQLPGRQDEVRSSPDYFPISLRPSLLYQYVQTTNTPSDQGPTTVGSGQVQFPEADLLAGGSIADNIAALLVVSGFGAEGLASIESAWLRLSNIMGTPWLNVRAGKLELDLPASEHRALTLTAAYAMYHYLPPGAASTFQIGENQLGVEIMGHTMGPGFRYSLAIVSANDNPGTNDLWSAPTAYAHITETFYPFRNILTRMRIGAFGAFGVMGTRSATTTDGMMNTTPIPGTFTNDRPYMQAGGELGFTLGPLVHPFTVQAVASYGQVDSQLVANATRDARYFAGFVEATYTPILRTTVYGRYDMVRALQAGDPMQPQNVGDIDGLALGARWALFQSWNAAAMIHLEASWLVTQGAGANGLAQQQTIFAAGLDVAL